MKKVVVIRGKFAHEAEIQNFAGLRKHFSIKLITSLFPLSSKYSLSQIKLISPADLPDFPYKYPLLNRMLPDAHLLLNLKHHLNGVDIAHIADLYYGYNLQAIRAKQEGRVKKIIATCWETIPGNNLTLKGRQMISDLSLKHIDHFVTPTEKARATLLKSGVKKNKISVVPYGVNLKTFRPNRTRKRKYDLVTVARLVTEKGMKNIIKIYDNLLRQGIKVRWLVVGSGPYQDKLEAAGLIVKQVPYKKIASLYQQAKVFVLMSLATPTWEEQYGMSLVEAMACGLPCVVANTGALPEVVSDQEQVVDPKNITQAANLIYQYLFDLQKAEEKYRQNLKLARTRYDAEKVSRKLKTIYNRL